MTAKEKIYLVARFCGKLRLKLAVAVLACGMLAMPYQSAADSPEAKLKQQCSGLLYRAKKDSVPIYSDSDASAGVVGTLSLGDSVCYIGEKDEFAIIDRRLVSLVTEVQSVDSNADTEQQLGYVRIYDLWSPEDESRREREVGYFGRMARMLNYMRYGGTPEDGLTPFDPILQFFREAFSRTAPKSPASSPKNGAGLKKAD